MITEEQKLKRRLYDQSPAGKLAKKAQHRRWYLKHKEKILQKCHEYYQRRGRLLASERRKQNPEKYRAYDRKWRSENRSKVAEYSKLDYQRHKAKRNSASKQYYESNKSRMLAWQKVWANSHPDIVRRAKQKWKKNNPSIDLYHANRRRFKIAASTIDDTAKHFYQRVRSSKSIQCYYCGKIMSGKSAHIDHVFAVSAGGNHQSSNLCASCPECNQRKGVRRPSEFVVNGQPMLNI